MARTELERLVIVETKLDALIKSQDDTNTKLDLLLTNYVARTEYEKDMENIRLEIEKSKQRSTLFTWITSTLAAVFGIVMTILVQGYFRG